MKKVTVAALLLIFTAFGAFAAKDRAAGIISTFRDIPNITAEEIAAVENLQKQDRAFILSMPYHTETFTDVNGNISGFSKLFCDWMSELFGIKFKIEMSDIGLILTKMTAREVDFSLIAVSEKRLEMFMMTDPIAYRTVKIMRVKDSPSLQEILRSRPVRYAFMDGSNVIEVTASVKHPFEIVIINSYDAVYRMLQNGEVDAFIAYNTAEAAFDALGGVVVEDFLPLTVDAISLATGREELSPVISLVTKAINGGAYTHLTELYDQGYREYMKNKFVALLTDEENEYLCDNPVIPIGVQYMVYPLNFYNTNTEAWEGISLDILDEVTRLTGLEFKVVNSTVSQTGDLIPLLEKGEIYLVPYLVATNNRMDRFVWSKSDIYMFDRFAMISKRSFPNVTLNDIPFKRVGLSVRSPFLEMFQTWFPNAVHVIEYPNETDVFNALDRGEIDLTLNAQSRITALSNYYEFSDYKVNFIFDQPFAAFMAFNKEHAILRDIIDKALPLIDTDRITEQWLTRTYNIESMRLREQRQWLVGVTVLFLVIFILITILFAKSRNAGRRLERIVAERTNELKTANEAKSRFLANMSHEIRTPMNSIIGFLELARDSNDMYRIREYLGKISENANLLLSLINDILDISKIESGKIGLERIPFYIQDIFSYCQAAVLPKAREKGLTLNCVISPPIQKKILVDPVRFSQALLNMLSNSVKFTNTGTVELSATVNNIDDACATLQFAIKDSGIGMTPEQITRIFEPFTQADTSITRKYGGTGLGLAIAQNIIKAMGGQLAVESAPGAGSSFTFELKFDFAQEDDGLLGEKDLNSGDRPIFEGDILICEDNEMNRQVICEHLKKVGLKPTVAQNGMQGVEIVKKRIERGEKPFGLILMDIHMPVMSGVQAASKLAALGDKTPVVALTANVMLSELEFYRNVGMVDTLGKPFKTQALWKLLAKYFPQTGVSKTDESRLADEEEKMLARLRINFVKSNRDTCNDFVYALEKGDINYAHRLAHTLKSNAGQIGEVRLQSVASAVEAALAGGGNLLTDEKIAALESELKKVLEKLDPLIAGSSSGAEAISGHKARELFGRLEPMLENKNPECMDLLDEIRAIEGTEELARLVEEFEFKPAAAELARLKLKMEE